MSDSDFEHLTEEIGSKKLKLLKQIDAHPYEYMSSFKKFNQEKRHGKKCFYSSVKHGTTGANCEKLHGHISDEEYLTSKKIWDEFNLKDVDDCHDN